MIKIFGIGNTLLCDDGIGVKVVEKLKEEITSLNNTIEVFIGETDCLYCLENISKDDYIIIVDGTYFETHAGKISVLSFEECDEFIQNFSNSHDETLLRALRTETPHIKGALVGIEIGQLGYSLELSQELSEKFPLICTYVLGEIRNIVSNVQLGNKTFSFS